MSLTNEDVSAIQTMMETLLRKELKPIQTDIHECRGTADFSNSDVDLHEICERAYEEFHRISYQLQISNQCLVDLRLDLNIFKDAVSKEFHSLNDKMDTVIEVLREKELLPR